MQVDNQTTLFYQTHNQICSYNLVSGKIIFSSLKRAKEIHGNKYDYSLVNYKKSKMNVKIICPTHGV
jgi:hypothetical protein